MIHLSFAKSCFTRLSTSQAYLIGDFDFVNVYSKFLCCMPKYHCFCGLPKIQRIFVQWIHCAVCLVIVWNEWCFCKEYLLTRLLDLSAWVGELTRWFLLAIYAACPRYTWGTPRVHILISLDIRHFNINIIVDDASLWVALWCFFVYRLRIPSSIKDAHKNMTSLLTLWPYQTCHSGSAT